jgi:hypothetical protein
MRTVCRYQAAASLDPTAMISDDCLRADRDRLESSDRVKMLFKSNS